MHRGWMGQKRVRGTIRGMITLQERWAEIIELQQNGQLQKEENKSIVRMRVEASAEEVEGIEEDANNFTSSS